MSFLNFVKGKKKIGKKANKGETTNNNSEKRVRFSRETEIIPQNHQRSSSASKGMKYNRRNSQPIMKKRSRTPILGILKSSSNNKSDNEPQQRRKTNGNETPNLTPIQKQKVQHRNLGHRNVQQNVSKLSLNESVSKLLGYSRVIVNKINKIEERQQSILENPVFTNSEVKISSMFLTPNGSNIQSQENSKIMDNNKSSEEQHRKTIGSENEQLKDKIRELQEEKIKHILIQGKVEKQIALMRVRLKVYENSVKDLEGDKQVLLNQLVDKERIILMLQQQQKQPQSHPIEQPKPERSEIDNNNVNQNTHEEMKKKYEKIIQNMKREKIHLLKNYKKMKDQWNVKLENKNKMLNDMKQVLEEKEFTIRDLEGEILELNEGKVHQENEIKDLESKIMVKKKKGNFLQGLKRKTSKKNSKSNSNNSKEEI